jgi:hypothetical protein
MKFVPGDKTGEEKKLESYTEGCCLCAYVKRPGCKPVDCCLAAYGVRK